MPVNWGLSSIFHGWIYDVARYTVPGRDIQLEAKDMYYPTRATGGAAQPGSGVPDNVYTRALGITDQQVEKGIASGNNGFFSAAWYAGKVALYNGWNFVTAGFVERQADRYQATVNGKLADNNYMIATGIDTIASIGAIASGGRVAGAILSKSGGSILSGGLSGAALGAAGGAEFTIIQKGGELGTYAATGYLPGGKPLDATYAKETFTELATSTAMGAGLGFLAPVLGDRLRANYKIVWNSPNTYNPLKFRLVEPRTATKGLRLLGSEADTTGGSILSHAGGELTLPSGATLGLPSVGSMNLAQATQWLKEQAARIPQMLNLGAKLREQAINAVNLKNSLITMARNTMDNSSHVMQLGLTNPIRSFEELVEQFGKTCSGNALYRKIIDSAKDIGLMSKVSDPIGCFVAGTLVHTKEGLKPIEQIKVGDLVLSKPENGEGEQAYKRVVKTFRFEEKEVVLLTYYLKEALESADLEDRAMYDSDIKILVVTGNHPFWVKGLGWIRADQLEYENEFELWDGRKVICDGVQVIHQSATPEVGWVPEENPDPEEGYLLDLRNNAIVYSDDTVFNHEIKWWSDELDTCFKHPVYNLEVEDYHTYYVGEMGVWVHNTNCGGDLGRALQDARGSIIPTHAERAYFTKGEATLLSGEHQGLILVQEVNKEAVRAQNWFKFESGVEGLLVDESGNHLAHSYRYKNPNGGYNTVNPGLSPIPRSAISGKSRHANRDS